MGKSTRTSKRKTGVERITISLPTELLRELQATADRRGHVNRSQAIAEMIRAQLVELAVARGDEIMTGVIYLVYDHSVRDLQHKLTQLQHEHIAEVISSLHVHLEAQHTLEVILVQGPASRLQKISDRMTSYRGVKAGKLLLTTTLLPPLHAP